MTTTTAIPEHIQEAVHKCIARANDEVKVVHRQAKTDDIINLILQCDALPVDDSIKELAEFVQGDCDEETLNNIYFLLTSCVEFVEDPQGRQDLLSLPALLKRGFGDCKSFSYCIGQLCKSVNIPYFYRFISQDTKHDVHHVYVAVPQADGSEIICDCTLTRFNREMSYAKSIDHMTFGFDTPQYLGYCNARGEDPEGNSINGYGINGPVSDSFKNEILKKDGVGWRYFVYCFWTESPFSNYEMPRGVIKKLFIQLQLLVSYENAIRTHYSSAGKLVLLMIDRYFNNYPALEIKPEPPYFFGQSSYAANTVKNYNWGINSDKLVSWLGPSYQDSTDGSYLINEMEALGYVKRASPVNPNKLITLTPKSITDCFKIFFKYEASRYYTIGYIRDAYKLEKTNPDRVLREAFDAVPKRSWFVIDGIQTATIEGGDVPDALLNTTKPYYVELSKSHAGKTIVKFLDGVPPALLITDKLKVTTGQMKNMVLQLVLRNEEFPEIFTTDTDFTLASNQNQFVTIVPRPINTVDTNDYSQVMPIPPDYLTPDEIKDWIKQHSEGATTGITPKKTILWMSLPDFQVNVFKDIVNDLLNKPKAFFIEQVFRTDNSAVNVKGETRVLGIIEEQGRIGLLTDLKASKAGYQDFVGIVWPAPKKIGLVDPFDPNNHTYPNDIYVKTLTLLNNGTYSAIDYNGKRIGYDPDGVVKSRIDQYTIFTSYKPTPSDARIGMTGGEIAVLVIPIIIALLSAAAAIIPAVLSYVALEDVENPGNVPVPDGPDLLLDTCVWYDRVQGLKACQGIDGNWYILGDTDGDGEDEILDNLGENPDLPGLFGGNKKTLLIAAAAGLLLITGIQEDKPRKKAKRVSGRTYRIAKRKWKKRA